MSLYDAVSHSFTTVSTGGFSPYQGSLGHFESAAIEWIAIIGMFLAGGSFTLYYRALRKDVKPLFVSTEFRVYGLIVVGATLWAYVTSGTGDGTEGRLSRLDVHDDVDDHDDRIRDERLRLVEPGSSGADPDAASDRRDGRVRPRAA